MNPQALSKRTILVLGDFTLFVGETLRSLNKLSRRRGLILKQCEYIGVTSLAVISVAAIFMGGVLGYQLYVAFHRFSAEALLGGSVGVSLYRELAPVMAGIMVTGRSGAAMAAHIATMKITEQVDALEVMAIDPIEFLVTPRVLAGTLMMPFLAFYFALIGTLAAKWVACGVMGLDATIYWQQYFKIVDQIEVVHCLVKAGFFGAVLSWVACFCGMRARGGAEAVGLATRTTVVASCLAILLTDFILTSLLPFGFPILRV